MVVFGYLILISIDFNNFSSSFSLWYKKKPPQKFVKNTLLCGGNYQSLIWGGSAPSSNLLPFYIPFWQERYPFYSPFIEKRIPFTYLPVTLSYEYIAEKGSLAVIFM